MPWGRVDDTWYDHPKLEKLEGIGEWPDRLAAAGLDSLAWSWCNRFLTDGHVPRSTVAKLGGTIELAEKLVAVGLWEMSHGTGFQIHDFLVYNDSRAVVLARRARETKRKADWRAAHVDKRRGAARPSGTPSVAGADVPPSVPASVPAGQGSDAVKLSRGVSRRLSQRLSRDSRPVPTDSESTPPTPSQARGRKTRRTNGLSHGAEYYDSLVVGEPDLSFEDPTPSSAPSQRVPSARRSPTVEVDA